MHDIHIFLNSENEEYGFKSFSKKMIEICNRHRKENRALAFAFILYDLYNPHLRKVLDDPDYWLALNEISGKYLTVFSLNYKAEAQNFKGQRNRIISKRYNPSKSSNELVSRYFGNIEVKYPSILFFQVNRDTVTDTLLIQLNEETIEQSFLELKKYIQSAVEALQKIETAYKNNVDIIFDNLEINVKSTKTMQKVKRVTKNAGGLIELLSSVKGLFV